MFVEVCAGAALREPSSGPWHGSSFPRGCLSTTKKRRGGLGKGGAGLVQPLLGWRGRAGEESVVMQVMTEYNRRVRGVGGALSGARAGQAGGHPRGKLAVRTRLLPAGTLAAPHLPHHQAGPTCASPPRPVGGGAPLPESRAPASRARPSR